MQPVQLPLGIRLREDATFEGYYPGPNHEAVEVLRAGTKGPGATPVYLWGAKGTGKSHLLQAACQVMGEQGAPAAYLPLAELPAPDVLEGMENVPLVCLDALECVAGREEWEEVIFHLFNRVLDAGGRLLIAARARPGELGLCLPDLVSRLGWGVMLRLQPLDDEEKVAALALHAQRRGLALPAEVGRYLIRRESRDLPALIGLLDRLDLASMAAQRRLTVPFVREVLETG